MNAGKLEALERRHRYLTAKIEEGDYSDAAASWAFAEVRALEWALPLLRDEIPARIDEHHRRELLTVARNATRLARAHPEMSIDTVASAAAYTDDHGQLRRVRV